MIDVTTLRSMLTLLPGVLAERAGDELLELTSALASSDLAAEDRYAGWRALAQAAVKRVIILEHELTDSREAIRTLADVINEARTSDGLAS
jgi:hypothetical protein